MSPAKVRVWVKKFFPSPIFFTVAPDVTRFGQEIGSIIAVVVVVVVIVVIADLQQKTVGPKIELQTVKKGGEARRGEEGGHSIISRSGMDGGNGRGRLHHRQKGLVPSEEFRMVECPRRTF